MPRGRWLVATLACFRLFDFEDTHPPLLPREGSKLLDRNPKTAKGLSIGAESASNPTIRNLAVSSR